MNDINVRDFGFDKMLPDLLPRIEALIASVDEPRQVELRKLAEHRTRYYEDAKRFLLLKAQSEWTNKSDSVAQRQVNIALGATHVMLRALTQFNLALAEIIQFGAVQGDLPSMETERILSL